MSRQSHLLPFLIKHTDTDKGRARATLRAHVHMWSHMDANPQDRSDMQRFHSLAMVVRPWTAHGEAMDACRTSVRGTRSGGGGGGGGEGTIGALVGCEMLDCSVSCTTRSPSPSHFLFSGTLDSHPLCKFVMHRL